MTIAEKFGQMFVALAIFGVVFIGILLLASLIKGRRGERWQAAAFLGPAVILLFVGLLYPAAMTVWQSFRNNRGTEFVGLDNYLQIFTDADQLIVIRNTAIWVLLVPPITTAIGLLFAILIDRARGEAFAKALIFLPMAISMVGASIIWKFMYQLKPEFKPQIGLLNQVLVWLGQTPQDFIQLDDPINTLFLLVIFIWIQAGFAMTILSAAIKAIPDDIIEAARLDGVKGFGMFRFITLPSIRGSLVVVLTTLAIGVLKVFDIVQAMTGGNFNTSVIANEFYTQSFGRDNRGLGSALAVFLFVLVVPIIVYNVSQLRQSEDR